MTRFESTVGISIPVLNPTSGALQVTYLGTLGLKKVEDLCEIAWGLGLKEEGIKEEYIKAIKDYLDAHPELCDNEQWAGLFEHGQ